MKYVVDTNIFNHLLDGRLPSSALPVNGEFIATNVQRCELERTSDGSRRAELLKTFCRVMSDIVPTESFAFDIPGSGFDESRWSDGKNVSTLKCALDARNNQKTNNWQDAIIAEVALVHGYGLITSDHDLAVVAKQQGIHVHYLPIC